MTGAQKAAVLCMALGVDRSSKILQLLSQQEVEMVSREIAATPTVGPDVVKSVMTEFRGVMQAVESVAQGGVDYAEKILEHTLGAPRAKVVLHRIQEQLIDTGLKRLRKASPEALASILRGEHPQTIALILAHLESRHAAEVVVAMEPVLAADVLFRVARMDKISPEMLAQIEQGLSSKTNLSLSEEMTLTGGPAMVAKLLNLAGTTVEKQMLEPIEARNPQLAAEIKGLMFVFEDLILIDGRGIQRVMRDVDGKTLALALKAASDELRQHIRSNMSERAAEALDEEIEMMGPVRVRDVEQAHTRIVEIVRALEEAGEILVLGRGGQDELIT